MDGSTVVPEEKAVTEAVKATHADRAGTSRRGKGFGRMVISPKPKLSNAVER